MNKYLIKKHSLFKKNGELDLLLAISQWFILGENMSLYQIAVQHSAGSVFVFAKLSPNNNKQGWFSRKHLVMGPVILNTIL